MFQASSYDHLYSTWTLPLWVSVLGVLICLIAGVIAAVQAERGAKVWLLPLALTPVLAVMLLGLALGPAWLAKVYGAGLELPNGAGPMPGRVFRSLIGGELAAWAAAVGAVTLGMGLRSLLGGPWRPQLALPPLAMAAFGLLLASAGPVHAGFLLSWGPLPTLHGADGARVHVGRSLDLTPQLGGTSHPERCEARPLIFAPEQPGEAVLSLQAHCGLLGVQRGTSASGGQDQGPEGFPLAVGNGWVWRHIREWHNQMLWFFPERGRHEGPDLHLRVAGSTQQGPLATWTLQEWTEGGEVLEHQIYQWDGQLLAVHDGVPSEQVFFQLETPEAAAELPAQAEGNEGQAAGNEAQAEGSPAPPTQACSLSVFPNASCRCLLAPHAEATLAGPSLCQPRRGAGDDLRAIGSALLAVMTIGLVIVDPDENPHWVLVRSGPNHPAPPPPLAPPAPQD